LTKFLECAKVRRTAPFIYASWNLAMLRSLTIAALLLFLCGCGSSDVADDAVSGSPEALTDADLDRFLSVVRSHEGAKIPEFTPPDSDPQIDMNAPATDLVASFQNQCRELFDVKRQGKLWERDTEWSRALKGSGISPARFAALVRDVSLAIMRVRLEARVDLGRLVAQARRQVDQTVRIMDEVDAIPAGERTREADTRRARSMIRLGQSVALLEFAERVREVPVESAAAVRRYSKKLKPLLPSGVNDELLTELKKLATAPETGVQPAGYEGPEGE
jgi:hypothetical protein